ncbi:group III truncated hemoglobin [Alcaligenes sp. SDU_A2]|uniref:group III truncated hemoglobin n=1 Tax=Alcaligenes sp. SDU_A2 TaxID=3136634 RepID=UPI002CA80A6E|nr:group III truncated hemoglobin [Alcaligenes sp.]HRL27517.1 group III truncated hemoglobin [Alcaligenes sp.]
MTTTDLCSRQEIHDLVWDFYDRIRMDDMLGPVFSERIKDWDTHLGVMEEFWSSLLLKTDGYQGNPMGKHLSLQHIRAEHFEQWLRLFKETCNERSNQAMAQLALEYAQRIARSFWFGYQFQHHPTQVSTDLTMP